ncbi:uncharacterized protein LOC130934492 [Arachis stenosperma]|uniref:uncharacterized protein LOC130934492 n=1 Tax=Arachis stenosperma TaxID=217475 RepID=UPI0025AC5F15|nr:uncharacterized protein LOC130934492 [Arachis stenosperma]
MAPYETLYGKKCQSLLYWYEVGEKSLLGPEMISEPTKQIKKIQSRMLVAQSRQKSYTDQRWKPIEFEEGEHVFLNVTPTTEWHRKYNPDACHVLEPESVQVREDLTLQVTPIRIDDTSIKRLRRK